MHLQKQTSSFPVYDQAAHIMCCTRCRKCVVRKRTLTMLMQFNIENNNTTYQLYSPIYISTVYSTLFLFNQFCCFIYIQLILFIYQFCCFICIQCCPFRFKPASHFFCKLKITFCNIGRRKAATSFMLLQIIVQLPQGIVYFPGGIIAQSHMS